VLLCSINPRDTGMPSDLKHSGSHLVLPMGGLAALDRIAQHLIKAKVLAPSAINSPDTMTNAAAAAAPKPAATADGAAAAAPAAVPSADKAAGK
jgi:hypothetical protein